MYKLKEQDYYKVLKILNSSKHSIFPATVCEGNNQGWIYVDNKENPKSALVYTNYLGGTLVGNSQNEQFIKALKDNLNTIIIPKVKTDNDEEFDLSGDSDDWDEAIKSIFDQSKIDIQPIKRFEYVHNDSNYKENTDFDFQLIKLEILKDKNIENIDILIEEIEVWYKDIEDFLDNSFGYISLKDNKLCGWSICVCKYQNKVEIAIETMKDFQKKGIATILSDLFINYCNKNNLIPEWECMDWNKASERIALKLGFKYEYSYNVYSIDI